MKVPKVEAKENRIKDIFEKVIIHKELLRNSKKISNHKSNKQDKFQKQTTHT